MRALQCCAIGRSALCVRAPHRGPTPAPHLVCSDAATSIAAVRLTPDGSHLVVSSRLVKAPGALSSIALLADGTFAPAEAGSHHVQISETIGRTPRDFIILPPADAVASSKRQRTERDPATSVVALVATQDDDQIVALCEGCEAIELTTAVPTPVCLCLV